MRRFLPKPLLWLPPLLLLSFAASAEQDAEQPAEPAEHAEQKTAPETGYTPAEQALLTRLPLGEIQWLKAGASDDSRFLALLRDRVTPPAQGVVVLVPDPASHLDHHSTFSYLRQRLNDLGWVTLALSAPEQASSLLPEPAADSQESTEQDPTAPPGEDAAPPKPLSPLAAELIKRLRAAAELAANYPGLFVVYAEGRSAAALAQLYQQGALEMPQALAVRAPYLPDIRANSSFALTLARSPVPVLDVYSRYDNRFTLATQQERLRLARSLEDPSKPPAYHQLELFGSEGIETHGERLAKALDGYFRSQRRSAKR